MNPGDTQPRWLWEPERSLWYYRDHSRDQRVYYDHSHDQLVYENGQRTPRSSWISLPQAGAPAYNYPQSPSSSTGYTSSWPPAPGSASSQPGVDTTLAASLQNMSVVGGSSSSAAHDTGYRAIARSSQPQIYNADGMRMVSAQNPDNGVRTAFATHPAERITDPTLLSQGVHAQRRLFGSPGESESLYSSFKLQKTSFFCVGRVFQVLWSEPAGESGTVVTSVEPTDALRASVFTGRYGERVYSKVRRFVVVRDANRYCTVLPIMSYGHQGVGKPGVTKAEHAIIYTGVDIPAPQRSELPTRGEQPMRPTAIRVVPDVPTEKLDPMSRINFGKVHTIEYNIKAKTVGVVHPHSIQALTLQFENVILRSSPTQTTGLSNPQGDEISLDSSSRTRSRAPGSIATRESGSRGQIQAQAGDDDQEDDDARAARAQLERVVTSLVATGWTRQRAITEATAGLQTQMRCAQLRQRGYTLAQALASLVMQLRQSSDMSESEAERWIQSRLSYGQRAQ